ncbi:MAG: potassium-transporting ATPase KdpC subunit [Acidimicrobiaceae bacterium]|nr:potassium-transporting ATPase KdpC subunit [Acidimicrobiaceae bacterium]
MRRQLAAAALMLVGLTVLCGIVYPLVTTAVAQVAFKHRADGSLIELDGRIVGSSLLGQPSTGDRWFHPRPSSAGADGYDGASSGASNLGPTNPALLNTVAERVAAYRRENGLSPETKVPVDAVTGSGSGLDPAISVANAHIQARRVARARGLDEASVLRLVGQYTTRRAFGALGEDAVNVLQLNIALAKVR